jgi:hypothetical protein
MMNKFFIFLILFFGCYNTSSIATTVRNFDLPNHTTTFLEGEASIQHKQDLPTCTTTHKGILAIYPVNTGPTENHTKVKIQVTFQGLNLGATHYHCQIGNEFFLIGVVHVTS